MSLIPATFAIGLRVVCAGRRGAIMMGGMATLKQKVAWGLWVGGCAFVVLSWFGIVSTTMGWCGFAIGLAGSALAWAFVPPN
jgi:hypothetical protein